MLLHALAAPLLFLAPALPQNEIVLSDGKIIPVKSIVSETYSQVTYKTESGGDGRKDAHLVKEVHHDASARSLGDFAEGVDLQAAGDFLNAIQSFQEVLRDERLTNPSNSNYWSVQHSWYRIMKCSFSVANYQAVVEAADRLLAQVPDTFFFGQALLMKAEALHLKGDRKGAEAVYKELAAAVESKGLPERWARESELGLVLLDSGLSGAAKRTKLDQIVAKNAQVHPTVAAHANVEIGGSYLDEEDLDKADGFFRRILQEPGVDDRTEASAWFGLGQVAYRRGLASDDAAKSRDFFFEGALSFLRVALMHQDAVSLVPESLCLGGICFNRMGDTESKVKALRLKNVLEKRFPDSAQLKRLAEALR